MKPNIPDAGGGVAEAAGIRRPGAVRLGLLILGVPNVVLGAWAVLFPHDWCKTFPGAGRHWLGHYGPYNSHLATDVGAGFFAIGLLLILAAAWHERRVVQLAHRLPRVRDPAHDLPPRERSPHRQQRPGERRCDAPALGRARAGPAAVCQPFGPQYSRGVSVHGGRRALTRPWPAIVVVTRRRSVGCRIPSAHNAITVSQRVRERRSFRDRTRG